MDTSQAGRVLALVVEEWLIKNLFRNWFTQQDHGVRHSWQTGFNSDIWITVFTGLQAWNSSGQPMTDFDFQAYENRNWMNQCHPQLGCYFFVRCLPWKLAGFAHRSRERLAYRSWGIMAVLGRRYTPCVDPRNFHSKPQCFGNAGIPLTHTPRFELTHSGGWPNYARPVVENVAWQLLKNCLGRSEFLWIQHALLEPSRLACGMPSFSCNSLSLWNLAKTHMDKQQTHAPQLCNCGCLMRWGDTWPLFGPNGSELLVSTAEHFSTSFAKESDRLDGEAIDFHRQ